MSILGSYFGGMVKHWMHNLRFSKINKSSCACTHLTDFSASIYPKPAIIVVDGNQPKPTEKMIDVLQSSPFLNWNLVLLIIIIIFSTCLLMLISGVLYGQKAYKRITNQEELEILENYNQFEEAETQLTEEEEFRNFSLDSVSELAQSQLEDLDYSVGIEGSVIEEKNSSPVKTISTRN